VFNKQVSLLCSVVKMIGTNEFSECYSPETLKRITTRDPSELKAAISSGTAPANIEITVAASVVAEIAKVISDNQDKCKRKIGRLIPQTESPTVKDIEEMITKIIKIDRKMAFAKSIGMRW